MSGPTALRVLAVAVVAVLGVAACSGDDAPEGAASTPGGLTSSSSPAASPGAGAGSDARTVSEIEDAADLAAVMTAAMRKAGTARLTLAATSSTDDGTDTGTDSDAGSGDPDGTGTGSAGFTGQGSIRLGDDPALQLTSTAGAQQVRLRLVGGAVYVGLGRQIMGKSWLKLDPGGQDNLAAGVVGLVAVLQGALDVDRSVRGFDQATGFEKTGRRTLDGVPTQGFEVVLEGDALRANLAGRLGGALGDGQDGTRATYRIHLDDEGRPKRVAVTVGSPGSSAAGSSVAGGGTLTTDYSDWGSPVTINPPPADQVR